MARRKNKFDSLDRRILQVLSENPTITFRDMAITLGIPDDTDVNTFKNKVFTRVQAMKKNGIITRTYLEFNPDWFGYNTKKILYITLCDKKDMEFFEDTMRVRKEARELRLIKGDYDYSMTCVFRSEEEFVDFTKFLIDMDVIKAISQYDIGEPLFTKTEFPFIL